VLKYTTVYAVSYDGEIRPRVFKMLTKNIQIEDGRRMFNNGDYIPGTVQWCSRYTL